MKKIFLIAMLAMGLAVTATAQTANEEGTKVFNPHWTLGVQGGAQYTLGEAKFKELLSPNAQLSVGYQPLSWLGLRLGANAWQSKGGFKTNHLGEGEGPTYKWNYVAPMLDVMFSLPNVFAGYNPDRRWDVLAFIGGGVNIGWKNDDAQTLATTPGYVMSHLWDGTKVRPVGRLGLAADYWVSDRVAVGLEYNWNILGDKYNSKKGGNIDQYTNALVGVKIALGKRSKVVAAPVVAEPVAEPVVEQKPVVVEQKPEPKPVVEEKKPEPVVETAKVEEVPSEFVVHFTLNRSAVNDQNRAEVEAVKAFLDSHPQARIAIKGYADTSTGNNRVNLRLAEQRAKNVWKSLQSAGIAQERLESITWRLEPQRENGEARENRVAVITINE